MVYQALISRLSQAICDRVLGIAGIRVQCRVALFLSLLTGAGSSPQLDGVQTSHRKRCLHPELELESHDISACDTDGQYYVYNTWWRGRTRSEQSSWTTVA